MMKKKISWHNFLNFKNLKSIFLWLDLCRIVGRKPMDVWAVRLAIGTYLIDGKHFRPLDLDGDDSSQS